MNCEHFHGTHAFYAWHSNCWPLSDRVSCWKMCFSGIFVSCTIIQSQWRIHIGVQNYVFLTGAALPVIWCSGQIYLWAVRWCYLTGCQHPNDTYADSGAQVMLTAGPLALFGGGEGVHAGTRTDTPPYPPVCKTCLFVPQLNTKSGGVSCTWVWDYTVRVQCVCQQTWWLIRDNIWQANSFLLVRVQTDQRDFAAEHAECHFLLIHPRVSIPDTRKPRQH